MTHRLAEVVPARSLWKRAKSPERQGQISRHAGPKRASAPFPLNASGLPPCCSSDRAETHPRAIA